jgi:hypothetical protein
MMSNRYIYALFFAGPKTNAFWGSLLAGAFAFFAWAVNLFKPTEKEEVVLLGLSLGSIFLVAPIIFREAIREFDGKLEASITSWVNAAESADERLWRHQIFNEGGVAAALSHMKSSGFTPAINIGGTPMADSFVDINGNPYGVDSATGGTDMNGMMLDANDAYHSPIGMDPTDRH